jgi:uncharacterized protein
MLINVTKVKSTNQTVERVDISEVVNAAAYDYAELCLTKPLHFVGVIENAAPFLELRGEVSTSLELVCSRCLQRFGMDLQLEIAEVYTNKADSLSEDDEIYFFEGDEIDIAPALLKAVFMELPMHPLCKPSCKGICPQCGADLNVSPCTCENDNVDIRLEKLKSLFDSMKNEENKQKN